MLSGMKRSLLLIGFQWYYKIQWKLPILAFFSSLLIREGDRFHLIPNRYGPIRAADREGSCCPTGWRGGQGRGRGCGVRCGRDNRRLPRGGGRRHRGWRWGILRGVLGFCRLPLDERGGNETVDGFEHAEELAQAGRLFAAELVERRFEGRAGFHGYFQTGGEGGKE